MVMFSPIEFQSLTHVRDFWAINAHPDSVIYINGVERDLIGWMHSSKNDRVPVLARYEDMEDGDTYCVADLRALPNRALVVPRRTDILYQSYQWPLKGHAFGGDTYRVSEWRNCRRVIGLAGPVSRLP